MINHYTVEKQLIDSISVHSIWLDVRNISQLVQLIVKYRHQVNRRII